jgi:hypothetical protein
MGKLRAKPGASRFQCQKGSPMPVGLRAGSGASAVVFHFPGSESSFGGGEKSPLLQPHGFKFVYSEWQLGQTIGTAFLYRYELREIMAGREIQNLVRRDSEKQCKSGTACARAAGVAPTQASAG